MKTTKITSLLCLILGCLAAANSTSAQTNTSAPAAAVPSRPPRLTPPTRDPHTAGYVEAKELPDGTVPPANIEGNFIIGPTHNPAPEMTQTNLSHGKVFDFTMSSAD